MSQQSQFVVENLTPKNPNGQSTATYELSQASVSPSRVIGRDARGFPIEETVPTVHWANFMMLDGCINKVPLRTGSVFSVQAEARAYEDEIVSENVSLGCIPAWLCPYSMKYAHYTGGHAFVSPPPGALDCGGTGTPQHGEGCQHLQEVGKIRRAEVLRKYNEDLERQSKMKDDEINRLRDGIVQGVGEAIAMHMPSGQAGIAARKQGLRDGKVE